MRKFILGLTAAGALLAGGVAAQDINDPAEIVQARHGYMLMMAMNLAKLGGMAKGDVPYDQAAATVAANDLKLLASTDTSFMWVDGTDSNTAEDSSALPEIFSQADKRTEKFTALAQASDAMASAAGTDLASLQGAMEGVGGACASCHKAYRKPE